MRLMMGHLSNVEVRAVPQGLQLTVQWPYYIARDIACCATSCAKRLIGTLMVINFESDINFYLGSPQNTTMYSPQ